MQLQLIRMWKGWCCRLLANKGKLIGRKFITRLWQPEAGSTWLNTLQNDYIISTDGALRRLMTNPISTHVALQRQERHKMTGELGRCPMNYKMTWDELKMNQDKLRQNDTMTLLIYWTQWYIDPNELTTSHELLWSKKGGGAVSWRYFDLLNSMIYRSR